MESQRIRTASEAINTLEGYMESVFEKANAAADAHWDFIYGMGKKVDWDKTSRLFLRCRKVGNSVQIEWYETRWIGTKANKDRRVLRSYIPRPKNSFAYPAEKLTQLARDWELESVLKTEEIMAECRRECAAINRAIIALRTQAKREASE